MPGALLNAQDAVIPTTTYDRCSGGTFDNPYNGVPSIVFFMQSATINKNDLSLISVSTQPSVSAPYVPGRSYQMYDPSTGLAIPGEFFTSDEAYAILYTLMRQAVLDLQAAQAAAAAAAAAAQALASANAAAAAADAAAALAEHAP